MAFVKETVMTATINFRDRFGKKATFEFGIKIGDAVTETVARGYVLSVATALQNCSNAMVQGTVLRRGSNDLGDTIPAADDAYRSIEDDAVIRIQPITGDGAVPVVIPSPKPALLLPDKVNLDPANTALGDFLTWAATKAVDYAGNALIRYLDGRRGNKEQKALPGPQLVLLGP